MGVQVKVRVRVIHAMYCIVGVLLVIIACVSSTSKNQNCEDKFSSNCKDCNATHCTLCKDRYYGKKCLERCLDNCLYTCHIETGICTYCKVGFHGNNCSLACSQTCRHQKDNLPLCDRDTGKCTDGCKHGFCSSDTACNITCNKRCKNHSCNYYDCKCRGCEKGYHGNTCQDACDDKCVLGCDQNSAACLALVSVDEVDEDLNCSKCFNKTCTKSTYCMDGCPPGYHGLNCEYVCNNCSICSQLDGVCQPSQNDSVAIQDNSYDLRMVCWIPAAVQAVLFVGWFWTILHSKDKNMTLRTFLKSTRLKCCKSTERSTRTASGVPLQDVDVHSIFQMIPEDVEEEGSIALQSKNRDQNDSKYSYPYNSSRVKLEAFEYINASHIHGVPETNRYIITQLPNRRTEKSFWYMIWKFKIRVVILLSQEKYTGLDSNIRNRNNRHKYDNIHVLCNNVNDFNTYSRRNLKVKNANDGFPETDVALYQHFRCAESTTALCNFIKTVRKHKHYKTSPVVILSSEGEGPSAKFLALDCLLEKAKTKAGLSISECINTLAEQRKGMFTNVNQIQELVDCVKNLIPQAFPQKEKPRAPTRCYVFYLLLCILTLGYIICLIAIPTYYATFVMYTFKAVQTPKSLVTYSIDGVESV